MAQKKYKLELSVVEVTHLSAALAAYQAENIQQFGRKNSSLERVQKKLDAATSAAEKAEDAKEVASGGGDDEPAADAD